MTALSSIGQSIDVLCNEQGLDRELIIDAMKEAVKAAARKQFKDKTGDSIQVEWNAEEGDIEVSAEKTVVETVEDPLSELSLADAQEKRPEDSGHRDQCQHAGQDQHDRVQQVEYLDAEEDFRVMRFEMRNVGSRAVDYHAPSLFLLTQLDDLLKMGRLSPARNMSKTEIERLRKANLSRHWGALNMKYIVALGINGQPAEASKQLRNIKALYGDKLYRSAVDEFRAIRDEKYPELALVKID